MAVHDSYQLPIVALVILQLAGCRSLSSTADKTIVNKFAHIDTLMITAKREPIEITDTSTIQKLKQLYEQARVGNVRHRRFGFKRWSCGFGSAVSRLDDVRLESARAWRGQTSLVCKELRHETRERRLGGDSSRSDG